MTRNEYHADTTRISKSGLSAIENSPLHYWDKYLNPDHPDRKQAKHFRVGDVCNDLLLCPDDFTTWYAVTPLGAPNKPTKAQLEAKRKGPETIKTIAWWNDFLGQHPNKVIVPHSEYETAQFVRDAVMKHKPAAILLEHGVAEQTIFFDEPITGAQCKCRPDWIATKARFLVDLKTSRDASPAGFGRLAGQYRYHGQGAFYFDGFTYDTGEAFDGFVFIVAEKERPFAVKCYYMDDDDFKAGRTWYLKHLQTYVDCLAANDWPGYGNEVERLRLPTWILNQ